MIWLLGLVVILQALFHWLLKPLIIFSTPIVELQWIVLFGLVVFAWLISASTDRETHG